MLLHHLNIIPSELRNKKAIKNNLNLNYGGFQFLFVFLGIISYGKCMYCDKRS